MRTWFHKQIAEIVPNTKFDVFLPPNAKIGDYSTNIAFILAKRERRNPKEVAGGLIEKFRNDKKLMEHVMHIEFALPGYINFFLKREFLEKQLTQAYIDGKSYGSSKAGDGKTVIVEYSSPNIAKPMSVGNLRSTVIGDALSNIYEAIGYKVIRWNYIGDWGTQFGKLIAAYKLWGDNNPLHERPVETLLELYVRFHKELKDTPELEDRGREEFKKLEDGDAENMRLWELFRTVSIAHFRKEYRQLGIKFDVWSGEHDRADELKSLLGELSASGVAQESEGALIVRFDEEKLPPALLRKSDGASLYFTREIASLKHRVNKYKPAKIVYVVGNEQSLRFEQLFAFARKMSMTDTELIHVKFGMVLGSDRKKLATREGTAVSVQDVITESIHRAEDIIAEKNKKLHGAEKRRVADAIGTGALKYNDLHEHRNSDIVFDWNKMLSFTGNSGPYLQYTYARLKSILRKAGWISRFFTRPDLSKLTDERERDLMKRIVDFPEAIEDCIEMHTTNGLALYLSDLANAVSGYYEAVRILGDDDKKRRNARLILIETVAAVLKRGLGLLGIQTPERI